MRIAVVGSRKVNVYDLGKYMPDECTEIISGGAEGVDRCAAEYARKNNIDLMEILPDYKRYGKGAPLIRNREIVLRADMVIAFWDGTSKGTKYVIEYCKKTGKQCEVILCGSTNDN